MLLDYIITFEYITIAIMSKTCNTAVLIYDNTAVLIYDNTLVLIYDNTAVLIYDYMYS